MSRTPINDSIGNEITKDNPKYSHLTSRQRATRRFNKRHKERVKGSGVCFWVGCRENKGDTNYCIHHNILVLERQRRNYARNKTAKI